MVVSMWDDIFWFYMKCYCRILLMSTTFGFFISMMLKNCKYSRSVAWHMEMNRKWCCVIFQDGTKLMWQGIKIMIFYTNFTTSNLTNATCYALLIDIVQQCITCCRSYWHFINEDGTCEFEFLYDISKTGWKASF